MLTPNLTVSANGHLLIGGADTVALAQTHGTPLYVMDETMIRENCRGYENVIRDEYNGRGLICYASKALSCKEMYRIVDSEGLGADVISGGELYTALQAGMPAEKLVMHGNSKSDDELRMAVENGVGRIVCDNLPELARLDAIAGAAGNGGAVFRKGQRNFRFRSIRKRDGMKYQIGTGFFKITELTVSNSKR